METLYSARRFAESRAVLLRESALRQWLPTAAGAAHGASCSMLPGV